MKAIMKLLNKLVLWLYDIIEVVGTIIVITVILLVSLGIVMRYVLNSPLTWVEEVCSILLIYICYTAASLTTVEKGHIVADFLSSMLPQKIAKIESYIVRAMEAFFLFFTVKSTFMLLPHLTEHSAVLQISRTVYYIPVGIFSAYMGFVIVVDLLNEVFPGFNYFAERQKLRDAAAAAEQERENQEMLERENAFISQSGIANDEGGNAL